MLTRVFRSFHAYNIGHLSSRASEPLFKPCTPAGVIRLLESTGVPIAGANAVVLGRSDIVGSPVAALLRSKDATVTQCHSRTKNLSEIVRRFASYVCTLFIIFI
jgi:methylenetetrahydrofolate dehydrogenase (NADP+) / methenyltetrahydrofolate cyclohydrolase / formyltetrahydrofolate synthetase